MGIIKTLSEVEEILNHCKQEVLNTIKSKEKQNPALKPLGNNAYTIRLSDLSKDLILSPKYYDFIWQYDALINKLNSQGIESFKNTINKVIQTGKLGEERIHPEVIKVLKELL